MRAYEIRLNMQTGTELLRKPGRDLLGKGIPKIGRRNRGHGFRKQGAGRQVR